MTTEVNVLYGRGQRSGGPEAVHQLVHELRALGVSAFVVPDRRTVGAERVPEYAAYDAPERPGVPESANQVVVAPEVYLPELLAHRGARRVCWWLSIDNSPMFRAQRYASDVAAGLADPPRLREVRALAWWAHQRLARWRAQLVDVEHLAQSSYAAGYLSRRLGVEAPLLSDYIPGADRAPRPALPNSTSRVSVAFNPAKGHRLLRRVQRAVGDRVDWLPIQGLSPEGVRERLAEATIYLDLGQHPGKDRLPREAALAGAVTVVARRGSGADDTDVCLPEHHKVSVDGDVAARAVRVLDAVLDDPAAALVQQDGYRARIAGEHQVFRAEVAEFAARLATSSEATT